MKPKTLTQFEKDFPAVWKSFQSFRDACDKAGPLGDRTCELIKVGIETACGRHGGLIAHMHRARKAGASRGEVLQAILQAAPLVGLGPVLEAFQLAQKHLK